MSGANSQGQTPPQGAQGSDAPGASDEKKHVTPDELNEFVNKAITSRFKAFESKFEKTLTDAVGGISAKLEELVKPKDPPPPDTSKVKDVDIENHPHFRGMKKTVDELNAKMRASEEEKQAIKAQSRNAGLRTTVSDALIKLGVDPTRVKHAVGFLLDAEKRARFSGDDSEEIVFRDSDNQDVDLNTGLKSWMKSDDAKIYLPARGINGSGARPPGKPQNAQGNEQPSLGARLHDFFSSE